MHFLWAADLAAAQIWLAHLWPHCQRYFVRFNGPRAIQRATGPLWMTVHADGRLTPLPQELDKDDAEDEHLPHL
jgi:hypothetical protein